MNKILSRLEALGYRRTKLDISKPIIIHSVAGSGKTTLIEKISKEISSVSAYTTATARKDLSGTLIEKFPCKLADCQIKILDEYPLAEKSDFCKFDLLFCDPYQYSSNTEQAHYILEDSFRIGRETSAFLRKIGFSIQSTKEDIFKEENIYRGEPEGVVICNSSEVSKLLERHSLEFKFYCEVIGEEFDTVTFVTEKSLEEIGDYKDYICLTRHSRKLKILHT
uniref:Triple gene block 1 n=1 Tax=Saffron betaflexivirus 1 TaxID=3119434 RepID=A0AAU6MW33_9VIRU